MGEGVSHLEEVDESWQQKRKNYHQKCENGMDESCEKKGKRLNDEDYHQKWENGTDESDEKEGKSSTGKNLKTMIAAELSSSEDDEWRGGGRRVWRSMRQG